jgi:hypothetical protein
MVRRRELINAELMLCPRCLSRDPHRWLRYYATVGVVALVVGIDGREIKDVRLRPPAATDLRFVSGDTVVTPSRSQLSSTLQLHGERALIGHYSHWRITICLPRSKLSVSENLHARIASGTDDPGHRCIKATVAAMRPSARRPLPDILRKIFAQ